MAENTSKTATYKIILDTDSGLIKVQGLTKGFQEADVAIKQMQESAVNLQKKGLDPMIDKTGLAGATVQEAGRTISDFNYGIRGMANNLSQLGSLFTNLISTTGGFTNAMRALWSALAGPLGIIIVFQTLLTVLEGIEIGAQKAEKGIDDMVKTMAGAGMALKVALEALNDENVSLEEKKKILAMIEEKYEIQNLWLTKNNKLYDDSEAVIEKYIDSLVRLARAQQFINQLTELQGQRDKLVKDGWVEQVGYIDIALQAIVNFGDATKTSADLATVGTYALNKELKAIDKTIEDIKKTMKEEDLFSLILGAGKKGGGDKEDGPKKDKIVKKVLEKYANTLEQGIQRMGLEKKEDPTFIDLMIGNTEEQLKESVKNTLDGLKRVAEDPDLSKYAEELRQERLKQMQEYAMQFGDVMNSLADFMDADFERQITMEQNKTNALNNELRLRLDNEKLSAEERASIQNQIYQNDEKLRKRQEQIEEKRFKMNKAANIANAVINTFLAATGVLAQTEGGALARIIGMTAVISAGLLQVAAIAKQKFQTSASSAPPSLGGAGGSGGGQQAPDFNIVGASGVNQLQEAIVGQLNRPIKTYVTTKDVSSGQELDRNIVNGATFGN